MGKFPAGIAARSSVLLLAAALLGSCTIAGSAVIAPYRSRSLATLSAATVTATVSGTLALAPNGSVEAVADPVHGLCLRSIHGGPQTLCAKAALTGSTSIAAAFSPDGQIVALGQDVTPRGGGRVWLVDARTGDARPVPAAGQTSAASAPSGYVSMLWNSGTGHLLLLSNATSATGTGTRLIDVDPGSLVPRVVAQATGPYEFQTGYVAAGGPSVIFTVTRGDQIPPNLVRIDLGSGVRRESGPLGANGTHLVPLAVSPNGREAIVGSATYGASGPPRRLDLLTGKLTDIPGLAGDFDLATYSPDGLQIAVVCTVGNSRLELRVAAATGAARMVGTAKGTVPRGSRLSWSGLDTLSLSGLDANAGAVLGWTLGG